MLLDTNIFIDYSRGYEPALASFARLLHSQNTSIITKLELIAGTRTKAEITVVEKFLQSQNISILLIDGDISNLAETLLKKYYHSHNLGIQDALIAATALTHNQELATRNTKHFSFIPHLKLLQPYLSLNQ